MVARESSDAAGAGSVPRRLLGAASSIAWILGALTVGWFLWPSSLGGCTTLTIVSGKSMEPTYYTGDLVVSRCGPVEIGDVIVYRPPGIDGARVIHRIVGCDAEQWWLIQGDNNDFMDPWRPTQENILGSSVLHLPQVGKFAAILLSPLTWVSLLVVALAVVVWPGREREQDGEADPDKGGEADPGSPSDDELDPDDADVKTRTTPMSWTARPRSPPGPEPAKTDQLRTSPPAGTRHTRGVISVIRAHKRPLIAVLLVLGVLATASVGSAASLTITGGSLGTHAAGRPCSGTLAATTAPTSLPVSTVTITPPAACVGRTVTVAVNDGVNVRQGTATAPASGSVTVGLDGSYSPSATTQVAAVVSGWYLPTSWAYTPPAVGLTATCSTTHPQAYCAADVVLRDSWVGGYNLDITVRDTRAKGNNKPYAWTVVIDFSSTGYPFVPNAIDGSGVVTASTCAQRPTLTFTGVTGLDLLGEGETRTFWIQPKSSGIGSVLTCP